MTYVYEPASMQDVESPVFGLVTNAVRIATYFKMLSRPRKITFCRVHIFGHMTNYILGERMFIRDGNAKFCGRTTMDI